MRNRFLRLVRSLGPGLRVAPIIVVSWIALASTISWASVAVFVVPAGLSTMWLVNRLCAKGNQVSAWLAGFGLVVLWSTAVEWAGPTTSGPVSRSVLISTGLIVAIVMLARTSTPALAVLPALGIFGGALGLGAVVGALWLTGLMVVAIAMSLVFMGPYGPLPVISGRQAASLVMIVSSAIVVASAVAALSPNFLGKPKLFATDGLILPPIDPQTPVVPITPDADGQLLPQVHPLEIVKVLKGSLMGLLWTAVAILVLLLLFVVVRRLWGGLRWRRLRRSLRKGTAEQQVAGAWTWMRMSRARLGRPLPTWLSPDLVAEGHVPASEVVEANLADDLRVIATEAMKVAGGVEVDRADARRAWACVKRMDSAHKRQSRGVFSWLAGVPAPRSLVSG